MKRLQAARPFEVAQLKNVLTPEQLKRALEPGNMTMPRQETGVRQSVQSFFFSVISRE
jgi:hypothetical protein